ncbi:hypothetical protein [Siccibacter colletis]|uniref:hypothetical protein n=1 Tax=Siccibacter colletis TaxID=1505757 RepID=UPI003CF53400
MDNYKEINSILKHFLSRRVDKENLIGLIVTILLNKTFFSTNYEVSKFIKLTFNLEMPKYVVRSRTLMVAKICRHLVAINDKEVELLKSIIYSNLVMVLSEQYSLEWHYDDKIKTVKNDALSNMNKWIGGILKKDK